MEITYQHVVRQSYRVEPTLKHLPKLQLRRAGIRATHPQYPTSVQESRLSQEGNCLSRYPQGCPCGYFGDTVKTCTCSPAQIQKYLQKISGPLLDRIDIHIEVPRLHQEEMIHGGGASGETSGTIRERVVEARERQAARFDGAVGLHCNAHMGARQIKQFCAVGDDVKDLLRAAIHQLGLSARAFDRILKLARTVADLDGQENIGIAHVAESIQYRALDRKLWG